MIFQTKFIRLFILNIQVPEDTGMTPQDKKIPAILPGLLVAWMYVFVKACGCILLGLCILCWNDKKKQKMWPGALLNYYILLLLYFLKIHKCLFILEDWAIIDEKYIYSLAARIHYNYKWCI